MFEKQNKIIIVDDNDDHLELLGKSFFNNGLGCRLFKYDQNFQQPLTNVRIAFFDINLTAHRVDVSTYASEDDILKNNSSVFNDLAEALNLYIDKNNGPYVLIFWTNNVKVINAFKQFMQNPERGYTDTASPILIECIDKAEYYAKDSEQNISDKVLELLNSDERIKFLFDLESAARTAGENAMNELHAILPKQDSWGDSEKLFQNLDKVLSKLGASTLGFENAKREPSKAIYEAIMPIINYQILNRSSNLSWDKIVTQLSKAQQLSDIISPDNAIEYKVNALYHIEPFTNQAKDVRGCVIEIDKSNAEILESFNIPDFDAWVSRLIPIKTKEKYLALKQSLAQNSTLVAVELSAACDYSQKRLRVNKYVLGVIADVSDKDAINEGSVPESSYDLGECTFSHDGNNFGVWLNLNHVFGALPNDRRLGNQLFVLKKEIMDMLGNKYASHVSRIGITKF